MRSCGMDTTNLDRDLMAALIAWTPAKGMLEHDPRVQAYIAADPQVNAEVVRKLQIFLLHGRMVCQEPASC